MKRATWGSGILIILGGLAYLLLDQLMPTVLKKIVDATWDQLPTAEAETTWRTVYVWIAVAFAVGAPAGALALWHYRLRDERDGTMEREFPAGRTALARLRETNNSELRSDVLTEIIESIVATRSGQQTLCRQILQMLVIGEGNLLKLVDWGDCGLTTYGRQKLIRDLRTTLVDDLQVVAIPALRQLEVKLRNTREAVSSTHQRLSRQGFGGSAENRAIPIEPEEEHDG